MNRETAHQLIDELFDLKATQATLVNGSTESQDGPQEPAEERVLPEGKRVVRTKDSGDRVFLLDEVKKTRQWITNPDALAALGYESTDVVEVENSELVKYQMAAAIQRVDG